MRVFLDFEASSLEETSYPIEVAWVFEDGLSEAHLIRPAPAWTDWDLDAEAIHRISRARLEAEGAPHDAVARRMIEVLSGHDLYASAPSWDGKWLSVLLRGAGLPRHALRLKDTDDACREAATELLRPIVPDEERDSILADILARVGKQFDAEDVRHRALADAERERRRWLEVCRLAEVEAARRSR